MKKVIPIVGVSVLAAAVAKAQDPVKVDPRHYKVVFDNPYVRILDVRQKPGDKSPMHSHPNHVVYTLAGSTLKFTSSDGKMNTVTNRVNVRDVIVPIQSFQAPTLINFLSRRWRRKETIGSFGPDSGLDRKSVV